MLYHIIPLFKNSEDFPSYSKVKISSLSVAYGYIRLYVTASLHLQQSL